MCACSYSRLTAAMHVCVLRARCLTLPSLSASLSLHICPLEVDGCIAAVQICCSESNSDQRAKTLIVMICDLLVITASNFCLQINIYVTTNKNGFGAERR